MNAKTVRISPDQVVKLVEGENSFVTINWSSGFGGSLFIGDSTNIKETDNGYAIPQSAQFTLFLSKGDTLYALYTGGYGASVSIFLHDIYR